MEWVFTAVSLICSLLIIPAHGATGTTVCYSCESVAGLACGLSRGWTASYLEANTQLCPEGVCYTYVKTAPSKSPMVYRGCGQLTCDALPAGYNTSDVCEKDAAGVLRVKKVAASEGIFNQSRTYNSQPPNRDFVTSTLQYCDFDRCNNGAVQFVQQDLQAVSAQPPTSCIQCRSQVTEVCGLKGAGGGQVQQVACNAGYCFTYVKAEAGAVPVVLRGCGGVPCSLIPGSGGSTVYCDEAGKLVPVDTSAGGLFNQSRSFYVPFGPNQVLQSGTVQYCNNGPNCNSGPIASFPLKNYYYLADNGSGASGVAVTVAALLTGLLVTLL
ncbi:uncharacterized protein LOC129592510 [Paramacrobiotus metropolitanus]|uniref:uncharacterized protein LOC129592510 n=1 Tax=Paramacrobiotus metropolitanus TaxID=2943436 RepID=UPI00244595B0|nr:uncharacterized protein LOC129592510 [Paramacrobiotus metropolitanus]